MGGINATGQIPDLPGNFQLVDKHTPQSAYSFKSYEDDEEMQLVFSDEFNVDGRSFYPGDDPFWEAVDMHYWGTVCKHPIRQSTIFTIVFRMTKSGMILAKVCIFKLNTYVASR